MKTMHRLWVSQYYHNHYHHLIIIINIDIIIIITITIIIIMIMIMIVIVVIIILLSSPLSSSLLFYCYYHYHYIIMIIIIIIVLSLLVLYFCQILETCHFGTHGRQRTKSVSHIMSMQIFINKQISNSSSLSESNIFCKCFHCLQNSAKCMENNHTF